MTKNILFITDLAFVGSGYMYLTVPLMKGLVGLGFDVKAVGLGNDGSEHDFPFSIIPAKDFKSAHAIAHNLHFLDWKPDVVVVALDVPHQQFFIEKLKDLDSKYIFITPLENGPLTMTWAASLMFADGALFISELATKAAHKAGLTKAKHIKIGSDTEIWPERDEETRNRIRKSMELDDKFVILSVADNQERKNLWAAMDIVSKVKKSGVDNLKYILVTREHSHVGHKIRDLALTLDINDELVVMERGLPQDVLWTLYAASDLYLNTSKGEGLGLPLLEAMSVGLPVMATNTGAMTELLADGLGTVLRGFLIRPEYEFTDVWCNSKRSMIDREKATEEILYCVKDGRIMKHMSDAALHYVKSLTWDIPVNQLKEMIEEVLDE